MRTGTAMISCQKAKKGSQFWLQTFVGERQIALDSEIVSTVKGLAGQTIEWKSPLRSDVYREYSDDAFVEKLEIELRQRPLGEFWPRRGPVWDGLARTSNGDVLLVEAKSHIPEAVSPASKAGEPALRRIRASLHETKTYLNGSKDADWSGTFYQITNRLAHLYLLRVLNRVPAHLVFIYFVGDKEMNGPMTKDEWEGAVKVIETYLGIGRTKLSPFVHHVFLDVNSGSS